MAATTEREPQAAYNALQMHRAPHADYSDVMHQVERDGRLHTDDGCRS